MARYISRDLSLLIRDRAYAAGKIQSIQAAAEKVQTTLARYESLLKEAAGYRRDLKRLSKDAELATKRLEELDKAIGRMAPSIKQDKIRPIKSFRRAPWARHGGCTASLAKHLQLAQGSITTHELVTATAAELGVPIETAKEYRQHKTRVIRALNDWHSSDFIHRLDEARPVGPGWNPRKVVGIWKWKGPIPLRGQPEIASPPCDDGHIPKGVPLDALFVLV